MRVLHVCASLDASYGGTAASCAQLASHLARRGLDVSVATMSGASDGTCWPVDPAVTHLEHAPAWPRVVGYAPSFAGTLRAQPSPDLIHLHGLWRVYFEQASRFARAAGARVVVTTHGMLCEQALAQRGSGKRALRRWYQDRVLREAACLHATSDSEADDIRRHRFRTPIAVLPWGVDVPPDDVAARGAAQRTVVYIGRLHPQKRLDTLLRAWADVQPSSPGWSLVLAGAAEPGYDAVLKAMAAEAGVGASVQFPGILHGEAREQLFAAAAVLVQPSPAENFGLAIAEALARGVPAIATHGAPWRAIERERCGWWVEPGPAPLAAALRAAIGMSDEERRAMGKRARAYARDMFDWDSVADAMIELYEWTCGRAPQPRFVQVDQ